MLFFVSNNYFEVKSLFLIEKIKNDFKVVKGYKYVVIIKRKYEWYYYIFYLRFLVIDGINL